MFDIVGFEIGFANLVLETLMFGQRRMRHVSEFFLSEIQMALDLFEMRLNLVQVLSDFFLFWVLIRGDSAVLVLGCFTKEVVLLFQNGFGSERHRGFHQFLLSGPFNHQLLHSFPFHLLFLGLLFVVNLLLHRSNRVNAIS